MTEHDCARIEELISAQMDGATTPEEAARIARHLGDCHDCQTTALAFARVDREVGDYLRATPVPAIDTPWREARRSSFLARWRPAPLALTTILVLVVASGLTFGALRGNARPTQQTSAPQSAYTTGNGGSVNSGAAASTAASAAPTAANPAVRSAATAASGVSNPAAGAAGGAPNSAASGAAAGFNPVRALRLDMATSVAVCQPDCVSSPHGAKTFDRIIGILNTALPVTAAPTTQSATKTVVLRFTFADNSPIELDYLPPTPGGAAASGSLKLPDGRFALAPAALGEVLAVPQSLP